MLNQSGSEHNSRQLLPILNIGIGFITPVANRGAANLHEVAKPLIHLGGNTLVAQAAAVDEVVYEITKV
jgi:hypothetical protein